MTAPELIVPKPLYGGTSGKNVLNKVESTFGDGYIQTALVGINAVKKQYTLKWVLPVEEYLDTLAILQDYEKGQAFLYTVKGDIQRQYKCSNVSFTDNQPTHGTINATFTEDFEIMG